MSVKRKQKGKPLGWTVWQCGGVTSPNLPRQAVGGGGNSEAASKKMRREQGSGLVIDHYLGNAKRSNGSGVVCGSERKKEGFIPCLPVSSTLPAMPTCSGGGGEWAVKSEERGRKEGEDSCLSPLCLSLSSPALVVL